MTCQECLERYSEFVDEVLDGADRERCRTHLERCPACARYHRVMQQGLNLAREMVPVQASPDFGERLQYRLYDEQDIRARQDRHGTTGTAVSLAVAATIALVAWAPVLLRSDAADSVIPVVAGLTDADAAPVRGTGEPGNRTEWYARPMLFPTTALEPGLSLSSAFPGPYSPLIVEPPVRGGGGSARTVLTSYLPGLD
jgi:hypothetical protein